MGAYMFKGNLWGRCLVVIKLADPWHMHLVHSVCLFDSQDMLKQRVIQGMTVPIESQWAVKAFNDFDYAFELTETKRFVLGYPIVPFLQRLRETDSTRGRFV